MIAGQMTIYDLCDESGLNLAALASQASYDPSTRTGCAIVTRDGRRYIGHNRFPRDVAPETWRLDERNVRLAMMLHAEVVALLQCYQGGGDPTGATVYLHPWPPCADCAGILIEAGVARVVAPEPSEAQRDRWGDSFDLMEVMFEESGVKLDLTETKEA